MTGSPIIKSLTRRYVAVLCVLAGLMIAGSFAFRTVIVGQETIAAAINVSGRQRALVQRIAMSAYFYIHSDSTAGKNQHYKMLVDSISLMERSHKGLTGGDKEMNLSGVLSPEIRVMYFNPPHEVNKKTLSFLADAKSVAKSADQMTGQDNLRLLRVLAAPEGPFMKSLDAIVRQHQTGSEARIAQLNLVSGIGLAVSLLVLAVSAFGVFSPLVRRTAEEIEKLVKSETRTRTIIERAFDCIVAMNEEGIIIEFNPSAEQAFGYDRDEVIGKSLAELLIPPRLRDKYWAGLNNYIATGEGAILDKRVKVNAMRADGAEFPVELAISVSTIGEHQVFTGYLRDITERKLHEAQLEKYQNELERMVEKRTSKLRQEVLERNLAEEALRDKTRLVEFLHQMAVAANEARNPEEAYQFSLENVCAYTGWPVGHVYIRSSKATNTLVCSGIWHFDQPDRFKVFREKTEGITFRPGIGLPGRVLASGKPAWIADVTEDPNFPRAKHVKDIGVKAAFALPVLIGFEVVAVLEFFSEQAMEADENLFQVLMRVGTQLGRVAERQRMEMAFKEGQQRLLAITGSIFEGVLVVDINGHIVFANRSAEVLLGRPDSAKLAGRDIDDVFTLKQGGEDVNFANSPFVMVAEGSKTIRDDAAVFVTSCGDNLHVAFAASPLLENGKNNGTIVSFRDITALKEAQDEALQASKLASVGQLAAGIAHEINTPTQYIGDNLRFLGDAHGDIVAVIDKYRKLALAAREAGVLTECLAEVEAATEDADMQYLLEEIPSATEQSLGGVEQVARIVLAMKEFSHPGSKDKTATDLNRAIKNTLMVCRNEWKHVADLDIDLDQNLPLVDCLPDELNQVFLNLIVNAAHAVEGVETNGKGRITITTRQDGDWADIRVADTGGGIPEDIRERIFDPFFTTKEVGKGTGQGLSICRDVVVKKHGGKIFFESEPGKGTTFVVRLLIDGKATTSKVA